MKQDYTDIYACLDRSGSTAIIADDIVGGYNNFLKQQKEAQGTATITLVQFDSQDPYEVVYDHIDIKDAPELTDFSPRGGTPLLDAIGTLISKAGIKLAAMKEEDRPEKVVVIIVTDGQENCSKEYTKEAVNTLIKKQTKDYSWEFVFLAANQDAIQTGTQYGFGAGNSLTFCASSKGMLNSFASTSANLLNLRSRSVPSMAYSAADRTASVAE